jgi:thiol-disulfide isomerase/thioredoxin
MRRHESRLSVVLLEGIFVLSLLSPYSRAQGAFDLAGKPIDPLTAFSGKTVVLVFVRSDCPISNRYAPKVQQLSGEYAGRAAFWLVYPDKDESPLVIRKHMQEYGYKIQALRDPLHALVAHSQVRVTPEAAVFDAKGRLVYHGRIDNWYERVGRSRPEATSHELVDGIEAALRGGVPPAESATPVGCYISDLR